MEIEETIQSYTARFVDFFEKHYKKEIERLYEIYPERVSLNVDFSLLEKHDAELADQILERPYDMVEAAKEAIFEINPLFQKAPNIRFFNIPEERKILIRNISSAHINKLIAVEGVVTKATQVSPKILNAVFQCRHCGMIYKVPQDEDLTRLRQPTICKRCERRSFQLLPEKCEWVDVQKIEIQEPLEILRGGEQVKKIVVILLDDLTNKVTPGDKILVSGVVRIQQPKQNATVYTKYIDALHVEKVEKEFEEIELEEEDVKRILELARDPHIYKRIVKSIAPSIYGHEEIKEAIALQLFGGTPGKVKPDGMKIRSDMHILLIGDPGTAKTQLLRYVKDLAPKGIYVSGKSTTGVGLTASAEKDEFAEGGWTLKAGALVLAAGGIALVDEFDKISDQDKAALHEAMESQEIHVAKAGIVTVFKANTAILAAANPKYGRFDRYSPPADQFDIPPTILSRFDLIFPVVDELDEKRDAEMADHVLLSHRLAGLMATEQISEEEVEEEGKRVLPEIEPDLLRKYIAYARKHIKPVLSEEAMQKIKSFYLQLRKLGRQLGTIPITARQLEAIVRLAEASAKVRLSNVVEIQDAERAIRLMKFMLKEIGVDPETGKIDVDVFMTGTPKSKADKIRALYRIIKRLDEEKGEAKYEDIVEEANVQGIKREELEELLNVLQRNGDIYSPKYGIYKVSEEF